MTGNSMLVFAIIASLFAAKLLGQRLALLAKRCGLPLAFTLDGFQSLFQPIDLFQQQLALRAIGIVGWHFHDHQHGRFTSKPPNAIHSSVNKYAWTSIRTDSARLGTTETYRWRLRYSRGDWSCAFRN
jgi:hypothetical protein